ncbi:MAG: hypothetical protein JSU07_10395 [Bacteroidetes bacterium]|nr:hypothetical protein [Bacteroidota bacterium]
MNKLIRQPVLSSNPADRRYETKLADGVIISHAKRPKTRIVESQLDWYEVIHSSILPSMAQRILESSSLDDVKIIATTLQQHICYVLHAVTMFRQYPQSFAQVFKYLESHREQCITRQANVAQPDALTLQRLQQNIMSHHSSSSASLSSSNTSNRSSTASSFSSSTSSKASSGSTSSGSRGNRSRSQHDFAHCGNFNSRAGCNFGNDCKYPHICRECRSAEHSKTVCPLFLQKQANKNKSNNSTSNNKK